MEVSDSGIGIDFWFPTLLIIITYALIITSEAHLTTADTRLHLAFILFWMIKCLLNDFRRDLDLSLFFLGYIVCGRERNRVALSICAWCPTEDRCFCNYSRTHTATPDLILSHRSSRRDPRDSHPSLCLYWRTSKRPTLASGEPTVCYERERNWSEMLKGSYSAQLVSLTLIYTAHSIHILMQALQI